MSKLTTILVADDHQVIIDGMEAIISSTEQLAFFGGAHNGHEVLSQLEKQRPDVVLMDINMPLMDGLECTSIVHKKYPDIRIIALSMHDNPRLAKRMFQNGALGFLLKNSSKSTIIEAIKAVLDGKNYIDPLLLPSFLNLNQEKGSSSFSKKHMLTKRELEIIKEICEEKTTAEIGDSLSISPHTVESHRSNILLKLELKNSVALVKWAIKNEVINL